MSEHFIHTEKGHCYYNFNYKGNKPIIYGLYIEKKYRRQGNAKHLLELVLNEIKARGFNDKIFIQAEPKENSISKEAFINFYESIGLTVLKDGGQE